MLEQKLSQMILETSRSHMKDLQTFFEEISNVKNLLKSLFQKIEEMSAELRSNETQIAEVKTHSESVAGRTARLESTLTEMDREFQKY